VEFLIFFKKNFKIKKKIKFKKKNQKNHFKSFFKFIYVCCMNKTTLFKLLDLMNINQKYFLFNL